MSPVSLVLVQNDNIHSMILDVHVFKVWGLKIPFSVEPRKPIKYYPKGGLVLLVLPYVTKGAKGTNIT